MNTKSKQLFAAIASAIAGLTLGSATASDVRTATFQTDVMLDPRHPGPISETGDGRVEKGIPRTDSPSS